MVMRKGREDGKSEIGARALKSVFRRLAGVFAAAGQLGKEGFMGRWRKEGGAKNEEGNKSEEAKARKGTEVTKQKEGAACNTLLTASLVPG